MNKIKINSIAVKLLMFVLIISSCDVFGSPEISVNEARLIPSRALMGVASAYLIIQNKGNGTDKLTGCLIKDMPSVKCRLHDVIDGKMVHTEEITIPAGKTTFLKKSFQHLMLYGLPDKIENEIPLILNFKKSGQFNVKAAAETG